MRVRRDSVARGLAVLRCVGAARARHRAGVGAVRGADGRDARAQRPARVSRRMRPDRAGRRRAARAGDRLVARHLGAARRARATAVVRGRARDRMSDRRRRVARTVSAPDRRSAACERCGGRGALANRDLAAAMADRGELGERIPDLQSVQSAAVRDARRGGRGPLRHEPADRDGAQQRRHGVDHDQGAAVLPAHRATAARAAGRTVSHDAAPVAVFSGGGRRARGALRGARAPLRAVARQSARSRRAVRGAVRRLPRQSRRFRRGGVSARAQAGAVHDRIRGERLGDRARGVGADPEMGRAGRRSRVCDRLGGRRLRRRHVRLRAKRAEFSAS